MSKRDRLGTVIRLRKLEEDRARAHLVEAEHAVAASEEEMAQRRQELDDLQSPADSLPPKLLFAFFLQGMRSSELLAEAEAEYERNLEYRISARRELTDRRGRRRSVERLSERRTAEALAQARIAADLAMDELVLLMRARNPEMEPGL